MTKRHPSLLWPLWALAATLAWTVPAAADSSGPRLAAYYERFMALCGSDVYTWSGEEAPRLARSGAMQVGVGRDNHYALDATGTVLAWSDDPSLAKQVLENVRAFHAGRSGLLVIREDHSLWHLATSSILGFGESLDREPTQVAATAMSAAVGDGADYYVTPGGELFVRGSAHRGQYGDGRLSESPGFVPTADDVVQVSAHTGHALLLKRDGSVWGTGGNIYGPLGRHGIGDKAASWGQIFDDARAIATGASHSLAIRRDGSLWIWGRNESLEPRRVMDAAGAVAAGTDTTIALAEGALWQWQTGARPRRLMDCAP